MSKITAARYRLSRPRYCFAISFILLTLLITTWFFLFLSQSRGSTNSAILEIFDDFNISVADIAKQIILEQSHLRADDNLQKFTTWNRSLCSERSDHRGAHQTIISLSIYGSSSKFTDNSMYSWETSITPFIKDLARECAILLPSWIIRIYIDFTGSKSSDREAIAGFSNIDVCDVHHLPLFGSSLLQFLPGKMWRFLPVFDPLVDFTLSRDVDSPMLKRETETLDLWLSETQKKNFFHIARDHAQHGAPILGGLWGAAPGRARRFLFQIFSPILQPSVARRYNGTGDQRFLEEYIWQKVKGNALIFDSYYCTSLGGQPFLSKRLKASCFLGCIRPCCNPEFIVDPAQNNQTCPLACRPKDHQDWANC